MSDINLLPQEHRQQDSDVALSPTPVGPENPVPAPEAANALFPQKLLSTALEHLAICTQNGVTLDQSIIDELLVNERLLSKNPPEPVRNSLYTNIGRLEAVYQDVENSNRCTKGWDLTRPRSWFENLLLKRLFPSYAAWAQSFFFIITIITALCLAYFAANSFLGSALLSNCIKDRTVFAEYNESGNPPPTASSSAALQPSNSQPGSAPSGETKPQAEGSQPNSYREKLNASLTYLKRWNSYIIDNIGSYAPGLDALQQIFNTRSTDSSAQKESFLGSIFNTLGSWWHSFGQPKNGGSGDSPLEPEKHSDIINASRENFDSDVNNACAEAGYLVTFMNYVLCASLGGILGSCVYVLRIISVRANKHDLWHDCIPTYLTRLLLGAICGAVISYFPSTWFGAGDVSTLSPIALSFITGYNIEVVFTALDKFMQAFAATSPNSQKENRPRG